MVGTVGTYYPACKRAVHHADTDNAIAIAGRRAKTWSLSLLCSWLKVPYRHCVFGEDR